MPDVCIAYGCTYRRKKGDNVGFFKIPLDPNRRKLWLNATMRSNWTPSKWSKLCGKHFQTGKPSSDENHPDYIPNVFSFCTPKRNAKKYEEKLALHQKRQQSRSKRTTVNASVSPSQQEPSTSISNTTEDVHDLSQSTSSSSQPPYHAVSQQDEYLDTHEQQHSDADTLKLIIEENERLKQLLFEKDKMCKDLECRNFELQNKLAQMQTEMNFLRAEKMKLAESHLKLNITDSILNNPEILTLYTSLHSKEIFLWLIKLMDGFVSDTPSLSVNSQLMMVLMKLKLNLLSSDIAFRFNVSNKTVQRVFDTWMPKLAGKLKYLIRWPNRKALKKYCPEAFKDTEYEDVICIIDCTEVRTERPSSQTSQYQTYSHYKSHHTFKFFVAATPCGSICFVSSPFGGQATDKEITTQSGFLNNLKEGDVVIGDRGFYLEEEFREKGAFLKTPTYTRGRKQMLKQEVIYSKKLSNVRIHIERVINLIKRYHILQDRFPIASMKYADCIIQICAALSNLCRPIVK